MGSFSLGGGKSKSTSQSSSLGLGYGYTGSGSESLSTGSASSRNVGTASSRQSIAFEDLFQQLYGGAAGAAANLTQQAPAFGEQAQQLFSGGLQFLDQLQGGAGEDYLTQRLQGNPQLDEQVSNLGEDIGQFFREQVNPAITSSAVANGQLGGGRQGVAQAGAAQAAAREFATGATNLRAQDLAATDAAAAQLLQGRTAAAGTGLAALPGLLKVGTDAFGAPLAPYQALAGILGNPTVLGQSESSQFGESSSEQIARAISEAFGENFSYDTSQASSRGKAWNLNLGGSFLTGGGS